MYKSRHNLIVDSGFFFGLFEERDQHHRDAVSKADYIEQYNIMFPWPILYETINTRLVRRPINMFRFEKILK